MYCIERANSSRRVQPGAIPPPYGPAAVTAEREGLWGIATVQAYERDAVERVVTAAHQAIVELRARLDVARQRLADLQAAAEVHDALAMRIGRMALDAQEQLRVERVEAERTAAAIAASADIVAEILGQDRHPSARPEASEEWEPGTASASPTFVLDLAARVTGDAPQAAAWSLHADPIAVSG